MNDENPLYKTIFRYLGIIFNFFVIGMAIYIFGLFHNIGNPSKGSLGDVALTLVDFYIGIVASFFLLLGTLLWKIGIKNDSTISSKEKRINKILFYILLIILLFVGFSILIN